MIDPAASFVEAARYLPALLFGLKGDLAGGLALNILLALLALPASLLLGVILGCFRVFSLRFLAPFAIAYTELVKSVPLVLMLFWMHYALPLFLGVRSLPPGLTAVAALTVYGTAQVAEVFRSGVKAVGTAQMEAALLAGMPRRTAARVILAPQVMHTMIPALLAVMVSLFKDSSVVFVLGLIELTQTGILLANRYPATLIAMYCFIALGFMAFSGLLTWLARRLRLRLARRYGQDGLEAAQSF